MSVSNENFKKIIKSNFAFHVGRNIKEVLYNHELLNFLLDKSLIKEKIFKVNHLEYTVSKMPMGEHATVAKFRSIKETISESDRLKREMITKGYFAKYDFDDIIGHSATMEHVKGISKKLAQSTLTILIYGESGSGKELFASAIHNASPRKNGPFLAVNFSALPDDLIESELFGYEEGAFTGAKKGGKIGLFEQADGGTLFLDEIGDVSLKLQARLLRVLQEKEIMRIGGTEIKPIDVRIVAATNKPLHEQVKNRAFREDLFHRLKMGYIKIPPLRDRKSDIPNLINYFLSQTCQRPMLIRDEVLNKLFQYDWYGNVRELKNTLDYMVAVSTGDEISLDHFPEYEFFQSHEDLKVKQHPSVSLTSELLFILKRINHYNENGLSCGRQRLSEDTLGTDYEMTDAQMRTKLSKLSEKGYVEVFKGKKGTQITEKGIGKIMGSN
jgi:transcriptional regulator with PAS, ATPase and Fis domain